MFYCGDFVHGGKWVQSISLFPFLRNFFLIDQGSVWQVSEKDFKIINDPETGRTAGNGYGYARSDPVSGKGLWNKTICLFLLKIYGILQYCSDAVCRKAIGDGVVVQ